MNLNQIAQEYLFGQWLEDSVAEFTQTRLAKKFHMSPNTVGKIAKGIRPPTMDPEDVDLIMGCLAERMRVMAMRQPLKLTILAARHQCDRVTILNAASMIQCDKERMRQRYNQECAA